MIVEKILAAPADAERSFWLDRGRRVCRLNRDGDHVIAEHRDGRVHRLRWPLDEAVPQGPEFARVIFDISARKITAAEG